MLINVVYVFILLYAAYMDYKTLLIKDEITLIIISIALIRHTSEILVMLIGSLALSLPFLYLAVKKNAFGGGDIKFIFANTMMLGICKAYVGILIGLGIISFQYLLKRCLAVKTENKNKVPLLPYLVTGFLLVIIYERWK